MTKETENVHYRDIDFLDDDGLHREAGWYFLDEEGYPYGPFLSEEHCRNGLKLYIMQLMAGTAPTQQLEHNTPWWKRLKI